MRINGLNNAIVDHKGLKVMRGDTEITVKDVCQESLLSQYADETNMTGAQKLARFALAMKLACPDSDYTLEELVSIKEIVGKSQGPLFVGRVWDTIDVARPARSE